MTIGNYDKRRIPLDKKSTAVYLACTLDVYERDVEKFSNCCFARILWDGRCGQCKEQCVAVSEDEA